MYQKILYLVAVFTKNSNVECFVVSRHGGHLYLVIKIIPQLEKVSNQIPENQRAKLDYIIAFYENQILRD